MNLENDLTRALRRESPAPGFAERVMQRIEKEEPVRRKPVWWRAAAASVTLAAIIGGYAAHEIHQRREGEHAKEQVLLALSIAGQKVRYAQQQAHEIGEH